MALFKSQVLTQASGSVGGLVYSRSASGMYMRSRAVPVNPQTARQVQVRDLLTQFSQSWSSVLTAAQRAAWDVYAANVSVLNRLGDSIFLTGQNHYIRSNVPRAQANLVSAPTVPLTTIDDAPTVFTLPNFMPPTSTVLAVGTDSLAVIFDDTASWVSDDKNAILVYMGQPRNLTRNFFKGPYRFAGMIQGDATTPPTSPATITPIASIFPFAQGQAVRIRETLTVGDATDQPTGLSAQTLIDAAIVG